jgi:hypothetical protein
MIEGEMLMAGLFPVPFPSGFAREVMAWTIPCGKSTPDKHNVVESALESQIKRML